MGNTLIIIDRGELKAEMLKSIYDKMNQLYKADGFYKKGEIK